MTLYVGDDWAEDHHDVHLMDESGERLAARRLPEGVAGVTVLHELVAQHASDPGRSSRRHRDRPRPLGLGAGRGRLPRVRHQPALGVALPRPPPRRGRQVRRRPRVHRPPQPPRGCRRQRRGRRSAHPRPHPPAARLGPQPPDQPAAQRAQGVLPGRTGGLPGARPRRCGRRAVHRARPARGGAAEHHPDPFRAQARRPPAQPRAARRSRSARRCAPRSSRRRPW